MMRKKYGKAPDCSSWQAITNEAKQIHKDTTGEYLIIDDNAFDWF